MPCICCAERIPNMARCVNCEKWACDDHIQECDSCGEMVCDNCVVYASCGEHCHCGDWDCKKDVLWDCERGGCGVTDENCSVCNETCGSCNRPPGIEGVFEGG